MRTLRPLNALRGLTLIVLTATLLGCASSGPKRNASMASSVETSAARLERVGLNLDATLASLNDLVNNPQPDLRPQFKKFSGALKNLDASSAQVARAHDDLQVKSTVFFENWEREISTIQNSDIRNQSQERKQQVSRQFDRVKAGCDELRGRFRPLVGDLKDIQRSLASDLTPSGVEALRGTVHQLNERATPRREETNRLAAQFRELAATVSPKRPNP